MLWLHDSEDFCEDLLLNWAVCQVIQANKKDYGTKLISNLGTVCLLPEPLPLLSLLYQIVQCLSDIVGLPWLVRLVGMETFSIINRQEITVFTLTQDYLLFN